MSQTDDFTADALYTLATEADISGRSDMTKDELHSALSDEAPEYLTPFSDVTDIRPTDVVQMNHLASDLTVTEVQVWTEDEVHRFTESDSETEDLETEVTPHHVIIMETSRGGRHSLVCRKEGEDGPVPWTNSEEPHLRRWRAGDQEWMNNSTDPVFIRRVKTDD